MSRRVVGIGTKIKIDYTRWVVCMSNDTPDYETIDFTRHANEDQIAAIRLDRPSANNTLTLDMLIELNEAIRTADNDDSIQGILLGSTSDDIFCAGADLQEISELGVETGNRFMDLYLDTIDSLLKTGKPVVAAVPGICVAGGNELALGCDLIVGAESARFGQPEVNVGATAAGGAVQILPLIVGLQRAKDLLLTGRLLSAEEAEDWGLINRVVPDGDVEDRVVEVIQETIDSRSPQAYRTMKAIFKKWNNKGMAASEVERELTTAIWATDEFRQRAEDFLGDGQMSPDEFTGTISPRD